MINSDDIQIRDSFVLPVPEEGNYYLFGTTDPEPWKRKGTGFDVFRSKDLLSWNGPFPAFRPPEGFWADRNFWAPEVHRYDGRCYMFASFKSESECRATQALVSESPSGPYGVHSPKPLTPEGWECLDGTLHIDEAGAPWLVFCHEWVQVRDGEICAVRLADNLTAPAGEPMVLFTASGAPWTVPHSRKGWEPDEHDCVTDGPFLYRSISGRLFMIWSSFSDTGYAVGVSFSESGQIVGPWKHQIKPLAEHDAGHGMLFQTFDGDLMLALHSPNDTPNERPVFLRVDDDGIVLKLRKPQGDSFHLGQETL